MDKVNKEPLKINDVVFCITKDGKKHLGKVIGKVDDILYKDEKGNDIQTFGIIIRTDDESNPLYSSNEVVSMDDMIFCKYATLKRYEEEHDNRKFLIETFNKIGLSDSEANRFHDRLMIIKSLFDFEMNDITAFTYYEFVFGK